MIIKAIHIDSFGKHRGLDIDDIPAGLTLITGNNESGKTTLMEFMRSTMFPSTKRALYPLPAKSDAGSMELETEAGERLILMREQKRVYEISGKSLPGERLSMDPETYRSVFAMDLFDLADGEAISSDRIRNRFLTIPGGEKVPGILKTIYSQKIEIMNDERLTERNPVKTLGDSVSSLNREIIDIQEHGQEYDVYVKELRALEDDIRRITTAQQDLEREKERRNVLEAQRGNIEKLFAMKSRQSDVEYASEITDGEINRYDILNDRMVRLNNELESFEEVEPVSEETLSMLRSAENAVEPVASNLDKISDRMESLKDMIAEDEEIIYDVGIPPENSGPDSRKELMNRMKTKVPVLSILLIILGAAAIAVTYMTDLLPDVVTDEYIMLGGALLILIGIFGLVFRKREGKLRDWMDSKGYPNVSRDAIPQLVEKLTTVYDASERVKQNRSELNELGDRVDAAGSRLTAALNEEDVEYIDLRTSAEDLSKIIEQKEEQSRTYNRREDTKIEISEVSDAMNDITNKYGGMEGFEKICVDHVLLGLLESETRTLRESVESATGMDVDDAIVEMNAVRIDGPDLGLELSQMNIKKGEIGEKMRSIASDDRLTHLLTEKNAKSAELKKKVKEWAMLSLQESMINMSCSQLYSKMQPSVISTANRYLATMTNGRYSIDPDPRLEEIMIRDSSGHKTSKMWSSGLGDQVYLSIKMAVAKEMGSERLPMILDDILVRFDLERRKAACSAILEFAKDQQVFLFSCDRSVKDCFADESEYMHIRL